MSHFVNRNAALLAVLLAIGTYRIALLPHGELYGMDEGRIPRSSPLMWEELAHGQIREAVRITFMQQGRPMAGVIGMIPALPQVVFASGWGVYSAWNTLVSMGIAWLFYLILELATRSGPQAVAGTALFALVHENSLWIRHLLSYDWAMLILLGVLYYFLSRPRDIDLTRRELVLCGAAAAIGFSTYPGYFTLACLSAGVLFLTNTPRLRPTLFYLAGFFLVIVSLEAVSRSVGAWNTRSVVGLSGTVVQGDFSEGWTFAAKYLWASDGVYAICLLFLYVLALPLCFTDRTIREIDPRVRATVVLSFLAYFCYGSLGVLLHHAVQYGRLIHQYVPFLVLGAVLTLRSIPASAKSVRVGVWGSLFAIGIVSFAVNARSYLPMLYTNDIRHRIERDYASEKVCYIYGNLSSVEHIDSDCTIAAVNVAYFREDKERGRSPVDVWASDRLFVAPSAWQLEFSAPHPLQYAPHRYSGYSIRQRANIAAYPPVMAVYRIRR